MFVNLLFFLILVAISVLGQTYLNEVICDGIKLNIDICMSNNLLTNIKLIDTLKVENIKKTLAEYSFSNTTVNHIVIKKSTVNVLTSLFNNKELLGLNVIDSNVTSDWSWGSMFNQFPNLHHFRLENSALASNQLSITAENSTKMLSISLTNCQIQSFGNNAFKQWPNLKMISLSRNRISNIQRNWFYPTLVNLWNLDFSYNKIETIPINFFSNMPLLKSLRLDNNLFRTLKQEWFPNEMFYSLKEFWIFPNPIVCQVDMCWIGKSPKNPLFFDDGECFNPNLTIKIRNFYELRDEDQDICGLNY